MAIKNRVSKKPLSVDPKATPLLLNEEQTAGEIGVSVSYLRKSRSTGVLKHKTPAPPHIKVGGRVFYRRPDIKVWYDDLRPQKNI